MTDISSIWQAVLEQAQEADVDFQLLQEIHNAAMKSPKSCSIVFGHSGWKGVIGEDFTVHNVQKVSRAIIELYRNDASELKDMLGVGSFEEFKKRGVLLGHDARFLGREFTKAAASVFIKEGVRVAYTGTATTPEFSAGVVTGGFACSVNLTPSHNPGNYGGYKFNPADGGPAGRELTSRIEKHIEKLSNYTMHTLFNVTWEEYDVLSDYIDFISSREFVDLEFCREMAHTGKVALAVDSMYGAARGRIYHILNRPKNLQQFRIDDEILFRGLSPQPSEKNMQNLKAYLDSQPQFLKLGVVMDPDGDRVQFYDGEICMSMNQFAVIAFHYMVTHRKMEGGVGKSVATSNFINAVAQRLKRPLYETPVGFENFKPYLSPGTKNPALICFEESDSISGYGNTLEKDAHIGFLLALEIIGKTGKSLTDYLRKLQAEFGPFYPMDYSFKVDKALTGKPKTAMDKLSEKYKEGARLNIGGRDRKISRIITIDGLKLVFEDESWILIRPSATEQKVRIYTESKEENDGRKLVDAAKELWLENMK
jgi:phosphomannomutase